MYIVHCILLWMAKWDVRLIKSISKWLQGLFEDLCRINCLGPPAKPVNAAGHREHMSSRRRKKKKGMVEIFERNISKSTPDKWGHAGKNPLMPATGTRTVLQVVFLSSAVLRMPNYPSAERIQFFSSASTCPLHDRPRHPQLRADDACASFGVKMADFKAWHLWFLSTLAGSKRMGFCKTLQSKLLKRPT